MRAIENLEELIQRHFVAEKSRVRTSTEMDKRVLDDALSAYATSEAVTPRERENIISRAIMGSRVIRIATAAVVLVVIGLFLLPGGGEKGVYAKAVEALQQVRTCHVVMKEYRDGQLFEDKELWYDAERGVIVEERYENRTDIRIDNRQYEWRYAIAGELAAQLSSYRTSFVKELTEWLEHDPKRDPSGDKVIDGTPCKMYTIIQGSERIFVWIDTKNRIRQLEGTGQHLEQKTQFRGVVEYGTVIDKSRFTPKFEPNVKVVNPQQLIEEHFPLDTAIFTRESLGFVFAVHQLERCERGFKYLVCSNRFSDETRQQLSDGHPWRYFGEASLFTRGQSVADNEYSDRPVLLAKMTHDGIQVNWYVLLPAGNKAKQVPNRCDVDVIVNTANQLEEKMKAEGLSTHERFRLNIPIEETKEEQLSLRKIASQIYSIGKQLDPIIHMFRLAKDITRPGWTERIGWKRPVIELSENEYTKDIERRVKEQLESSVIGN
ncbi:hypothetical protein ES702_01906 [subsurface metagenome]